MRNHEPMTLRRIATTCLLAVSLAAALAVPGTVQGQQTQGDNALGNNRYKAPGLSQTMNFDSCAKYSWAITGSPCCKHCKHGRCCPGYSGTEYTISYWEPSEIIEVSCRSGYSLMSPGKVPTRGGGSPTLQSCHVPTGDGQKRWFFEARVWAIDGSPGGARHKSSGGFRAAESVRQCTNERGDDTWSSKAFGYGSKKDGFSKGSKSGPAGAWEAYISDSDPQWATAGNNAAPKTPPDQAICKHGSPDVEKCWGTLKGSEGQTGWIAHPNQAVAAAAIAWRAHTKAANAGKVSKPGSGGGYKINMDYPFIKAASPFAQSQGMSGGSFKGSRCFKPGDPGPYWYTQNEEDLTPEKVPAAIQKLKMGEVAQGAEVHPGVYIFTVWVYTKCKRYSIPIKIPTPTCHYKPLS